MVLIGLIGAKQRHPSNAGLNVQVFFAVADARDKLETGLLQSRISISCSRRTQSARGVLVSSSESQRSTLGNTEGLRGAKI